MMQLVPVKIDGAVVLNVNHVCPKNEAACGLCFDYAVAVHNWLMAHELNYVIIDFQDEKEVCSDFLIELLQLRKRLRYPFLFAGLMDKPRRLLESYDYGSAWPICLTPEEALRVIKARVPAVLDKSLETIKFDEPIPIARPRQGQRFDAGADDEESVDKPEEEVYGAADVDDAADDDDE
jgi:hypothetical protein